jgi:hypothetical protein
VTTPRSRFLILMLALIGGLYGEDPVRPLPNLEQQAQVKELITTMINSLYAGQAEPSLDLTHPKIIAMMGGREAAERTMAGVIAKIQAASMKLESLVIAPEPVFYQGTKHLHVIVESTIIISFPMHRVESRAFRLGILQDGGWRFAEGSRLTPAMMTDLFPDFPPGIELPKTWQRPVDTP